MKNLKIIKPVWAIPIALAVTVAGCAVPDQAYYGSSPTQAQTYPGQAQSYQVGVVDRIEVVNRGSANNVAGTIIGGIIGGLIGTQIGSGSGRTAATIAGAAGGAIAGNVIEGRRRANHETYRVTVRLANGSMQTVTQENISDLHTGDRVRVEGNLIYRI